MTNAVTVEHASKRFKEVKALDDVTLSFEQGRIHGIIGRNGSGKTVLLKCICGFMKLTEGSIRVFDQPVKEASAQDIGIIIEAPGFIGSLSAVRNLEQLYSLRHKKVDKELLSSVLQKVGLDPQNKKPVRKYSMGMKQRLGIAQAIMEDAPLLLLDEPMNGLDNQGVADMRKLFLQLKTEGKTILLCSHNREDIAILCDTVCELDHGKVISREDCAKSK